MSKRPAVHPGPRVRWVPKAKSNDAEDAIFLASAYGLIPDDWQRDILFGWLGRRADGKWCAGRCGLAVPRQNGKNAAIEVRELFGMVVLGEKILHTAHEVKTARKAFKRLLHFFDSETNPAAPAELVAMVVEIRKTNGQEAIILSNGGSIEFVARSKGSGRGFTVDVLILDEAQALSDDELEAIRSSVSSAPLGNPQVIYTGTPPNRDKGEAGEVWLRIRTLAGKDKRLSWIEYGAPDGPIPDLDDVQLLYEANPALDLKHANGAYGLQMDVVKDERGELSASGYARERLGWWGDPKKGRGGGVVDMPTWMGLRVRAEQPTKAEVVVDVSPDLDWTTVALASEGPDGRVLVLVDHLEGTGQAVAQVRKVVSRLDTVVEVALTPTAQMFSAKLTKAKIEHKVLTNADVGRGCTAFQEAVRARGIAHVGQQVLDDAARNATTRYVGDTQQWERRDHRIDVSAMVAAATAAQRWSLLTAKPKTPPAKPQRASASARRRPANDIAHAGF